jgi:hypothetical protein
MKHTLLLLLSLATSACAYEALQGPTERLYWDKTDAYNGYTWFGVRGTTYLVHMEGRVAHTWPVGTNPHLLTNGNVLDASKDDPSGFGGLTEVTWSWFQCVVLHRDAGQLRAAPRLRAHLQPEAQRLHDPLHRQQDRQLQPVHRRRVRPGLRA